MILIFLSLFIILILFLQQWSLDSNLDVIEGDFFPDENVVDPDAWFDISIKLKNHRRFPLFYVKIQFPFSQEFVVHETLMLATTKNGRNGHTVRLSTWLNSHEQTTLRIPVAISKRGRYLLSYPTVYLGDFLGLNEHGKDLEQFREVVVAPKEWDAAEVSQVLGKFLGEYSVRRFLFEDPILTLGYREYTGREPFKMISWKQSAQRQQLMVKEYDYTVEPVISVLVNVETDLDSPGELLEKCFSLARSVCHTLESRGISYDFYTNAQITGGLGDDNTVNDGLGERHFLRVMELLGRSMYTPSFSFSKLLELAETAAGTEHGKIIITPDSVFFASDPQTLILQANLL